MVIASRFLPGGARHDRDNRLKFRSTGHRVYTLLANLRFFGNTSDALSTFRAIRTQRLNELKIGRTGLPAAYELSIDAMQADWKVAEIPTIELVNDHAPNKIQIVMSLLPLLMTLMKRKRKK